MKRPNERGPRVDEKGRRIRRPPGCAAAAKTIEIIRLVERPSFLIQHGTFAVPAGDRWVERLAPGYMALEAAVVAVGRIALGPAGQRTLIGTGFLVGPDLLVTNRHVAVLLGEGQEASVDLRGEHEVSAEDIYPISEILRLAPEAGPDVALLRLGTPSRTAPPLRFADTPVVPGHCVATVGYPGYQHQASADFSAALRRIFRGIYDVKRLAPGEVLAADATTLAHDCTNLPGSSGSAVLDVMTGHVVGLDYGALPGRNLAVPGWVVADWLTEAIGQWGAR